MRMMGHEFNLEVEQLHPCENNIFAYLSGYDTLYTDSGRSALRIVTQVAAGGELLVPDFSCVSVVRSFAEGVTPVYYRINRDFSIDLDDLESKVTPKTKAIYVTPYYGKTIPPNEQARLRALKSAGGLTLIEDTTHSIFSEPCSVGDYCLSSIRKWFPVPDGGVVYAANGLDRLEIPPLQQGGTPEKLYVQIIKTLYLRGQIDILPTMQEWFAQREQDLDHIGYSQQAFALSDLSRFLFSCFDVYSAAARRRENERALREAIDLSGLYPAFASYAPGACPFRLACYSEQRDEFEAYLRAHGVWPSILWRTHEIEELRGLEPSGQMGREIVCFPVDQRYTPEDMRWMADVINAFAMQQAPRAFSAPRCLDRTATNL